MFKAFFKKKQRKIMTESYWSLYNRNLKNIAGKVFNLIIQADKESESKVGRPRIYDSSIIALFVIFYLVTKIGYKKLWSLLVEALNIKAHFNTFYKRFKRIVKTLFRRMLKRKRFKCLIADTTGLRYDKLSAHRGITNKINPKMIKMFTMIDFNYNLVRIDFGKYSKKDYKFLENIDVMADFFIGDLGFLNPDLLFALFKIPVVKVKNKKNLSELEEKLLENLIKLWWMYLQRWIIERMFWVFKSMFGDRLKTKSWRYEAMIKTLIALEYTDHVKRALKG